MVVIMVCDYALCLDFIIGFGVGWLVFGVLMAVWRSDTGFAPPIFGR